jgi:hypothetical protein
MTFTEIHGDDILEGTDGDDLLVAVDAGTSQPGAGEEDVLVGGSGADIFFLGDGDSVFYDDGLAGTSGTDDYAVVWDLSSSEDQISLHGSPDDYLMTTDAPGLPGGTAIWLAGDGGAADELIGVVQGVAGLAPTSGVFVYTDFMG